MTMQSYPSLYVVETVVGCNLSCPECAVGDKSIKRKHGMMSFENFVIIADKIRPYCKDLHLYMMGEPMLNRDLFKMIAYAQAFARTHISTNANTLTEDSARELVQSGIDSVYVSVDGMSQETYSTYRRGGDLEVVLKALGWLAKFAGYSRRFGMRYFLRKLHLVGKRKINIIPQFIVFKHNEHEMDEFRRFCAKLGVRPHFRIPHFRSGGMAPGSDPKYRFSGPSSDPATRKLGMKKCTDLINTLTVLLDGSIVACCYDRDGITSFGNLFTQDMEEIMNSPARAAFSARLAAGDAPDACLDMCCCF